MKKYVQTLRDQVVEMSRNFFDFADGEEFADFDDVVDNPMWAIMRRGMWERVMLCSYGQFDGKAILLMGKVLPLEGLRIAKHANGILAPGDAQGPLPSEHCPMVLHDGYRHFKALLPFCEISESEASGGTDGELEGSGGTDEEEGGHARDYGVGEYGQRRRGARCTMRGGGGGGHARDHGVGGYGRHREGYTPEPPLFRGQWHAQALSRLVR